MDAVRDVLRHAKAWDASHRESVELLRAMVNFAGRLPLLGAGGGGDAPGRALAALHVARLEALMAALREELGAMEACQGAIGAAVRGAVGRAPAARRGAADAGAAELARAAEARLREWLVRAGDGYRDELLFMQRAAASIRYDDAEHLAGVLAVWRAQRCAPAAASREWAAAIVEEGL